MTITIPVRKTDLFREVCSHLADTRTKFNAHYNVEESQWEIEIL